MLKYLLGAALLLYAANAGSWGFYGHKKINQYAIYLLPPEMMVLYKPNLLYLKEHAVDADKRRYILKAEAPRHYIDMDRYGKYPFPDMPRRWEAAVEKYGEDSLQAHGILPWRFLQMMGSLTKAFKEKNKLSILKLSADLGHYIGDAHVPLHTSSNHNGQHTGQHGIHGFWESRVPELLAENEWDFFLEKAQYIENPSEYIWTTILESAKAVDSVLHFEAKLNASTSPDLKFAYERRNEQVIRQYSSVYSKKYDQLLNGMIERRMRQAMQGVASCWYTAWINAGQPDLKNLPGNNLPERVNQLDSLEKFWRTQPIKGKSCD